MEASSAQATQQQDQSLAQQLEVLANPLRIALLRHLANPAFMADLVRAFGVTRQALRKHLESLESAGLILSEPGRRGPLPATRYRTDPAGLFAFKEEIQDLGIRVDPALLPVQLTRPDTLPTPQARPRATGLLLVHGETAGRWFNLEGTDAWILGRAPQANVCLGYDAFASARHALLRRDQDEWTLTDLNSTNGTRVNFQPVPPGEAIRVAAGDLLTIGRSHLLLRARQ